MAILYSKSKHAFHTEGPTLTEQEHKDSCDINLMLKSASQHRQIRGGGSVTYGYDDTTMDGVQHRILKNQAENELSSMQKEVSKETFDLIPKSIRDKFGFKIKAETPAPTNDDQTTKNEPKPPAPIPPNPIPS